MNITISRGDITLTRENVDAILTPVNLTGLWYGGVDIAINKVANIQYHQQLQERLREGLHNLDTVRTVRRIRHQGKFRDVLFVVDTLETPLSNVVFAGLMGAEKAAYATIAMSAMRTGNNMGKVEQSLEETVNQMKLGLDRFLEAVPDSELNVMIVVHHSDEIVRTIKRYFFL